MNHIHYGNKMVTEQKDRKLIYLKIEANRDLPKYFNEIYFLEYDANNSTAIEKLRQPKSVSMKNYDASNHIGIAKWMPLRIETTDFIFPLARKTCQMPNCMYLKMTRPQNLDGIDFSSSKNLQRLDLSFCDSKMNQHEIMQNVL